MDTLVLDESTSVPEIMQTITAVEAAAHSFDAVLDLAPADDSSFLIPAHGDVHRRPLSYQELSLLSNRLASALPAAGIPAGSRVACALPNGPELAALVAALPSSGYSLAPLNPALLLAELTWELGDVPAKALLVLEGEGASTACTAAAQLNLPVIELRRDESVCGGIHPVDLPLHHQPSPCTVSRQDVALVMHTSGTTRRPKVVPIIHRHLASGTLCVVAALRLQREDVCLNAMPLFHLHGLMVNVLATCTAGAALCCATAFDASRFLHCLLLSAVDDDGNDGVASAPLPATWYSAVPTIHLEVMRAAETAEVGGAHTLQLIRNCSAALAPSISTRLEAALPGACVLPTYAMTEALPICATRRAGLVGPPRDLASVGPATGPEVAVLAAADETPCAVGSEGEVSVRGVCVMAGYEQRAHLGYDPNDFTMTPNGWLRTGDKGWLDDHGRLFLTGRFKEIINRAGEKISPLTVEHVLLGAAGGAANAGAQSSTDVTDAGEDEDLRAPELRGWVRDLLAFAAPHDELGEVVGVAVVCEKARTVTLAQLRRVGSKSGLSRHWLPEVLVIMAKLPKGPTGKPARIGLAEAHEIPVLSLSSSMKTIDLRAGQPKDFEAGRRAAARREAAQRAEVRKTSKGSTNGNEGTGAAIANGSGGEEAPPQPLPLTSMEGCVLLVVEAMEHASGEVVGKDDDLFDAGLSSISAARLREFLDERVGCELPYHLVYDNPTVRSLAAAIVRVLRASSADHTSNGDEEAVELLLADAAMSYRDGRLPEAEALCLRVAGMMKLDLSDATPAGPATLISAAAAPMLVQLVAVWSRMERWHEAANACRALIATRDVGSGANPVDVGMLWAQLAKLTHADGDTAGAAAAIASGHKADPDGVVVRRSEASLLCAMATSKGETVAVCCEHGDPRCAQALMLDVPRAAPASWCVACAAMQTLVITRQRLKVLPASLSQLAQLRVLDASDNELASLGTHSLAGLVELHELLLGSNELTGLPEWLGDIPRLSVLNVQANRLAILPAVVLRCRHLRHLRWGLQKAAPRPAAETDSADDMFSFESLHLSVLELEGNGQTCLAPMHVSNTVLTALLSSFNELRAAPAYLSLYGSCLKRLHLGGNQIASLEGVLAPLTNLTCLCVESNRLKALPDDVGQLLDLRELCAYGNELTTLPAALGECVSLTKLEANHNQLIDLPDAMSNLTKLKSLYVQSNHLRGLSALQERIFRHLPLTNLGLGCNELNLSETVDMPGVRVGLAWNTGMPPEHLRRVLTDRIATVDHLYEPMCKGHYADVLLVAFAAQGAGMQQWVAPCSATRAAGVGIDALYLADPSNSYYLQDPGRAWNGIEHYQRIVASYAKHYARVIMIGSSMGGTAALVHAHLADRVLSFGPKLDLWRCHGEYLPTDAKRACAAALTRSALAGVTRGRATTTTIHVGSGNLEDVLQARRAAGVDGIDIISHDTFHHNVPMYLEREGLLVTLFKREVARLLQVQISRKLEPSGGDST